MAVGLPGALGFVIPLAPLLEPGIRGMGEALEDGLAGAAATAVCLAGATAAALTGAAFCAQSAAWLAPSRWRSGAWRVAQAGYAIPGAALAIALFVPLARLDNGINDTLRAWLGIDVGLLITGSAAILLIAYGMRYVAVPAAALEAGGGRLGSRLGEAARSLGEPATGVMRRAYLPAMFPFLVGGGLAAFLDLARELPMTTTLRPLGMETLATRIHERMTLGLAERAAPEALTLAAISLPVALLAARLLTRAK